jgi:hypothetical protein
VIQPGTSQGLATYAAISVLALVVYIVGINSGRGSTREALA